MKKNSNKYVLSVFAFFAFAFFVLHINFVMAKELIEAVRLENINKVESLLKRGSDIHVKDKNGVTALMQAASNGAERMVQILLDNNADIHTRDKKGNTALMWAAVNGKEKVVRILLENKSNIYAKNNSGNTALILAVISGDKNTIKHLLNNKSVFFAKNNDGITPLMMAYKYNNKEIINMLIKMNTEYSINNITNISIEEYKYDGVEISGTLVLTKGKNIINISINTYNVKRLSVCEFEGVCYPHTSENLICTSKGDDYVDSYTISISNTDSMISTVGLSDSSYMGCGMSSTIIGNYMNNKQTKNRD